MPLAVISGFAAAPAVPLLYRIARGKTGWYAALLPLVLFIYFASLTGRVIDGETITATVRWVPSLDVNLSFRLDSLGLIFALIITGIGTLIFIYAGGYLNHHAHLGRFYAYLMIFMASMLGVVMADNLMLLFIFWELTSFSSYLLISFNYQEEKAREAARQALIVTGMGGLVLIAGFILLALVTGNWNLSAMTASRAAILGDPLYLPILILIAIGAFTKSAQFPFHFWLPGAMKAPAPVSAYLHSATMVKAGIYLLMRLNPVLGDTEEWHIILMSAGAITLLVGGYIAWQQTDLKRILAYSTVSALGIMVFLLGVGTETAIEAAVLLLVVHALYKGALFMVGGIIDHETGTRDITHLGGLRHRMPMTTIAAALAALSMAGIPPLLGFLAKEVIYESQIALDIGTRWIILLTAITLLGNLFNVTAAGLVVVRPFHGSAKTDHGHEPPLSMWLGPLILGLAGLFLGLFAGQVFEPVLTPVTAAVYGEYHETGLKLWHGLSTLLLLSAMTLAGGALLYVVAPRLRYVISPLNRLGSSLDPGRLYTALMDGSLKLADWGSAVILRAYLRQYIRVILLVLIGFLFYVFQTEMDLGGIWRRPDVRFYELIIAGVIIAAAIMSTQINRRLSAAAALGVVGYCVTLIYVLYGAPDLAMTQFAIETLTVILFVLVIYRLPKLKKMSSTRSRVLDAIVALTVGGAMTVLTLVVTSVPLQSRLSPFFGDESYLAAHGRNVVNVILVDFRGFDTMGEITVLSVAAIGVFALLRLQPKRDDASHEEKE